ncbi:MAG: hypothetical protein JSV10_05375 [Candidatus Zixiibacteriota bacterium]|nr:MAG: hypothetical protein JSV10_05375 [candidate division Zixibacteria bacterium]
MSQIQTTENRISSNELQFSSLPEVLDLLQSLVKKRKWIYFLVGVTVLTTVIFCLLLPNQYTATAVILPSGGTADRLGGLKDFASLAGEFSFASAGLNLENSSYLYPDILRSRLISEAVISKVYHYPQGGKPKSQNLFGYFKVNKMDNAIRALAQTRDFDLNRKTGIITISATTTNRYLSAAIANEYIDQLEKYNLDTKKSKAKENEEFIFQRLEEVQEELKQAEDNLEVFQLKNRNFNSAGSPELAMELARSEREVEIKSRVFLALTQQYELARVGAKKDVPIVQVLDYATPPEEKSAPNRKILVLTSFLLSSFLGIALVLSLEAAKARIRPDEYRRALHLGIEFKTDVIKVYRQIKRSLRWFTRIRIKRQGSEGG